MDHANSFIPSGHGYPFPDMKRYSKGSELDNGSVGDFLTIDDLLDFTNDDIGGPIGEICHTAGSSTTTLADEKFSSNCSSVDRKSSQAPTSVFDTDGPGELCVPCDDLAELEWLSNFVEESFSSGDIHTNVFLSSIQAARFEEQNKQQFQSASPVSVLESSACSGKIGSFSPEMSVPGRARSKRCRTGVCFWNTRILSGDASASILESCSTSTVTATTLVSTDSDAFAYGQGGADSLPAKKFCKANHESKGKKGQDAAPARRCLHCGTQKTPQWRAGPMGPKTLCNACGVRYKSGRLLPEYRPAASPTFVETIHSNSHRRVLEMRRQREANEFLPQEGQLQLQFEFGDDECLLNEREGSRDDV